MAIHHFSVGIDPRLGEILAVLEGSAIGAVFKDRAIELATSGLADEPLDHGAALRSQLWVLERVATEDIRLTAAGYLKPADVKAVAEVLPTMKDWIFRVTTEVHTQPVLYFRRHLAQVRLVRKYKGKLSATKVGRMGLADPGFLWTHLASTLIPNRSPFDQMGTVIVLVHMGTTEGQIDVDVVARTMSALGNVGDHVEAAHHSLHRTLSRAAIALIREALFTDDPIVGGAP
jgi:hypothetical protein